MYGRIFLALAWGTSNLMKYKPPLRRSVRLMADKGLAARRLLERAHALNRFRMAYLCREDQRPVPVRRQGHASGIQAGLQFAIERGWLELHESGTYVKFTAAGADLFA